MSNKIFTTQHLRNERGAFDLMSILFGVAIIGVLTAIAIAGFTLLLPWVQDEAAKSQLATISTSQDMFRVGTAGGYTGPANELLPQRGGGYATSEQLAQAGFLAENPDSYCVLSDGDSYTAYALSQSGTIWSVSNLNPNKPVVATTLEATCLTIAGGGNPGGGDEDEGGDPVGGGGDPVAYNPAEVRNWYFYYVDESQTQIQAVEVFTGTPADAAEFSIYWTGAAMDLMDNPDDWDNIQNPTTIEEVIERGSWFSPSSWGYVYAADDATKPASLNQGLYNAWVDNGSQVSNYTADDL